MPTRSECAAIDFVMESAAITTRSERLRPTKHRPMSHKAENTITKEENDGVDWGSRPPEEVPLRGGVRCTHDVRHGAIH